MAPVRNVNRTSETASERGFLAVYGIRRIRLVDARCRLAMPANTSISRSFVSTDPSSSSTNTVPFQLRRRAVKITHEIAEVAAGLVRVRAAEIRGNAQTYRDIEELDAAQRQALIADALEEAASLLRMAHPAPVRPVRYRVRCGTSGHAGSVLSEPKDATFASPKKARAATPSHWAENGHELVVEAVPADIK
jgi:hypothetical protein